MDAFPVAVSTRRLVAAALLVLALVVLGVRHLHPDCAFDVDDEAGRGPRLVHLAPGSRVADAVAGAGGATRLAARVGVNLAAPVSDGQQVVVPRRGSAGSAPAAADAAAVSGPVSLSSATAEQLDALPGVGPVTAQKIVDYRTQHGAFHSVDELDAIPGIGPARLADLRGLVVP